MTPRLVLVAAALAACDGPRGGVVGGGTACPSGQELVDGLCQDAPIPAGCTGDADCGAGRVCDPTSGECVFTDGCGDGPSCPPGMVCTESLGLCQADCRVPQHRCPPDRPVCDAASGLCGAGGACSGVTCSGHGSCDDAGGAAVCVCEPGYEADGLACVSDRCFGVTCSGHGSCDDTGGAPLCLCAEGFRAVGLTCAAEPCFAVTCSGHGSCDDASGAAACVCELGYEPDGLACVPDPCSGVTCSGHGSCDDSSGAAVCRCGAGFRASGLTCVLDPCYGITCSGHGACDDSSGSAACACEAGYEPVGLVCAPDLCAGVACSGHGSCDDSTGSAVCACEAGYVADGDACLPETIDFHLLATGRTDGSALKIHNPAIDTAGRRLYVAGGQHVAVIDLDADVLLEVFPATGAEFLFWSGGTLYSASPTRSKCFVIDPAARSITSAPWTTCAPIVGASRPREATWGGLTFSDTGYEIYQGRSGFRPTFRQDLNAAYGVIEISDASGTVLGEIIHGPDALYLGIDATTNKLYTSNTGDSSISVFDLSQLAATDYCADNSCFMKTIDTGSSADEVLLDGAGVLWARSRLGGSVIHRYDTRSGAYSAVVNENVASNGAAVWLANPRPGAIGMWPSGIGRSGDDSELYVLSHYAAAVDVLDAATGTWLRRIDLSPSPVPLRPRTDSITTMLVDRATDRIYVGFPEAGRVVAVGGQSGALIGSIDLAAFGFNVAAGTNAGQQSLISLAVSSAQNRLYVYLYNEGKLLAFAADTLAAVGEAAAPLGGALSRSEVGMLSVNDELGVLYLANQLRDPVTLGSLGSQPAGQWVVGADNATDTLYLAERIVLDVDTQSSEWHLHAVTGGAVTAQWTLDVEGLISPSFAFDFSRGVVWVSSFSRARVSQLSLR